MPNAIVAQGLTKKYGRTMALDAVDFQVPRGSIFGVIGPNGAGKTTTMRLLLDIIHPSSGNVEVLGVNPHKAPSSLRRRIGFLPGELELEGRISARALLRQFARISGPVKPGRIDELAERLGVELKRPIRKLSKGNKQKIGLIQAFMHEPELLILDEPTSGLDPLVQQEFLSMLTEARERGQSVFLSSHVLSEVQSAADVVSILRSGRILETSTVAQLRESAARTFRVSVDGIGAAELVQRLAGVPGLEDVKAFDRFVPEDHHGEVPAEVYGQVSENVSGLIQALAPLQVRDLFVEEPDLEKAVLGMYGPDTEQHEHHIEHHSEGSLG